MITIRIPDFVSSFPFTTRVNPFYADAKAGTTEWVASYGVLKHNVLKTMEEGDFAYFGAVLVPDASKNDLRLFTDFVCWLFLFDDICEVSS
jgi:hypothetical protein